MKIVCSCCKVFSIFEQKGVIFLRENELPFKFGIPNDVFCVSEPQGNRFSTYELVKVKDKINIFALALR